MLDYRFCDRTVTLYRREADGIRRWVVENVYYLWKLRQAL